MLPQLMSHNDDIRMLVDKGYEVEIRGGQFLLVHHVPYVNDKKQINYGTLVESLIFATTEKLGKPSQHYLEFIGDPPCNSDGGLLIGRVHGRQVRDLGNDIIVYHRLSAKPHEKQYPDRLYPNYYEKIRTYVEILMVHARQIDPSVTATPNKHHAVDRYKSVFTYPNTNSAKARISGNSKVFENLKIAIIGVGGTGCYLLDLVAKTEVAGIHLFDDDVFQLHNAFRAPGAAKAEDFTEDKEIKKVNYFTDIYSAMHRYIHPHPYRIDQYNISELEQFHFVFICIDDPPTRYFITNYLKEKNVPLIDTGLGVEVSPENQLVGKVRVTTVTEIQNTHLSSRISATKARDDAYNDNIQIAELNALNATLAVLRWKRHIGYYQDLKAEHNSFYFTNTGTLMNEYFKPQTTNEEV